MAEEYRQPPGLPEFDRPPINEMAMGVDFAPVRGWNVTHYGLLYRHFASRYPRVETQPPLPRQVETFEGPPRPAKAFELEIVDRIDTRCWFIDESDSQLLQVQSDRFLRNWRKREGGEYPRYRQVRQAFVDDWREYVSFLKKAELAELEVRQCELTYYDHLERPAGGLPDVFSFWRSPDAKAFLPAPERGGFNLTYRMGAALSRLHVALQPAVRISDGKEILQLTFTGRGVPASGSVVDLLGWFDMAHEWIARGFVELVSERMQREWGKRERP